MVSDAEAKILLTLAREAIVHLIEGKDYNPSAAEQPALQQHSGCFVTITQNGQLRGCIGNFQSHQPLYREVVSMAVAQRVKILAFLPFLRPIWGTLIWKLRSCRR